MSSQQLEQYLPPGQQMRPDVPRAKSHVVRQKWAGTLPDKFISSLVTRVSQTNLQQWVLELSTFHTRHSKSTYISQVADWLVARFQELGYTDVFKHAYSKNGYDLHNIVCTKSGTGTTNKVTLICAHYDCIAEDLNDATAQAPGASDNASGVAVLLEVARILSQVQLEDDVQFVAFSGEEQGFWGSTAYAQHVQDNGLDIRLLINLDEIGCPMADSGVVIEYDMGNHVATNDQPSMEYAELMAQMAADYCSLPVSFGPIYGSDYMPFEYRGYVVIGIYEGEGNPNYHSANDTASTVDSSCMADVARMTLATALHETTSLVDESDQEIDVYIRDSSGDDGSQPSAHPHWESPDIWVRNNPPPADPDDPSDPSYGENPGDGHQAPINDVPNYLYVNVHNRGSQPASGFSVRAYHCNPGTAMLWPDDFHLMGTLEVGTPVPPNNSGPVRVGPFIWTPEIVDHECLLAIVSGPGDHAFPDIYSGQIEHGLLVRFDNNVGQRNVQPAASTPGGKTKTSFLIRGTTHVTLNSISIDAGALPADTRISIRVPRAIADGAKSISGFTLTGQNSRWSTLALLGGAAGSVTDFCLGANEQHGIYLTIDFSYQAQHLKRYAIVASQEQEGVVAGRLTIEITAVKESEDYVYGNARTRELHALGCVYRKAMQPRNQVPFQAIRDALARGYNGCAFCLPNYDTG